MNRSEASDVAAQHFTIWRRRSYEELASMIDSRYCEHTEVVGPSGTTYQIDVTVFWDDRPGGNLRVSLSIDDGGWRALLPLTESFIKAPDGSFVEDLPNKALQPTRRTAPHG